MSIASQVRALIGAWCDEQRVVGSYPLNREQAITLVSIVLGETTSMRLRDRSKHPCIQPSPCCGDHRLRDRKWDAYFCRGCGAWLEPPCDCPPEDNCPFSEHALGPRPEKVP